MKKTTLLFALSAMLLSSLAIAQNVGINETGTPGDASAGLDVDFDDKGVLIPRVALTARNNNAPIGAGIETSLLVYNTATSGLASNAVSPGYYFWNGFLWIRITDDLQQDVTSVSETTESLLLSNNTGTYSVAPGVGYTPGIWQNIPNTTITPTITAGNKVRVSFNARWEIDTYNYYASEMIWFRILRGSTEIARTAVFTDGGVDGNGTFYFVDGNVSIDIEDTGASAGAQTYTVQYWMTNYSSFTEAFFIGERYTKVEQIKP